MDPPSSCGPGPVQEEPPGLFPEAISKGDSAFRFSPLALVGSLALGPCESPLSGVPSGHGIYLHHFLQG